MSSATQAAQSSYSRTDHLPHHQRHQETVKTIGDWIFEDILCWWGILCEIVTDNGLAFIRALTYLSKRYHVRHICILGYNSHTNGIAEQAHFNIWQALFKACDGNQSKWHLVATSVLWANCITVHQCMGCSPYFATTGMHLLLPLDITEATYLLTLCFPLPTWLWVEQSPYKNATHI